MLSEFCVIEEVFEESCTVMVTDVPFIAIVCVVEFSPPVTVSVTPPVLLS